MTLSTSGYTVGASNQPLNHARILWNKMRGTVTATGTNGALADNDYTFQRWALAAGLNTWDMTGIDNGEIDTLFIGAHSLAGNTIRPKYRGASATNLFLRSEEFDNAYWAKTNATVTANTSVAPDGTATADTLTDNVTSGQHQVNVTLSVVSGATYTLSAYVKRGSARYARLSTGGAAMTFAAIGFDLQLGTVFSGVGSIQDVGNGWYRISASSVATSTGNGIFAIGITNASLTNYSGIGDTLLIWGAQLQTGALSSYIRTTSATVTSDWQDIIPASPWVSVTDNSTIAIMANDGLGQPFETTGFRVTVPNAVGNETVGIIRAAKALQMQRPVFGGVQPIGLSRIVETRHAMSETGQWLGRTIQRQARRTSMNWMHLNSAWYRSEFEPFSLALPQTPFGLIQNPLRMPESVAWCWTDETPAPENMGIRDLMSVSLGITGYLE